MNSFKARSRALRAAQTAAEDVLWRELRGRRLGHWKFRRQHPIGHYVVDFVTLDGKLVIEVDGATHSTDQEQARDASRTKELERMGFHVFRVSNTEVYRNLDGVTESILHAGVDLTPHPPRHCRACRDDLSHWERLVRG